MGGSPSSGIKLKELPTGLVVGAPPPWTASVALAPEDLFVYWDAATGCEGLEFAAGALEESVASPLGRMPSANQTLLCSRGREPSEPGCLRTPTGTMTVGGGELSAPEACACCRGGIVEQYSDGLLGFGLWLQPPPVFSHVWAFMSAWWQVTQTLASFLSMYTSLLFRLQQAAQNTLPQARQ